MTSALDCLSSELHPDWVLPEASPEFRKKLAICLFYKVSRNFFNNIIVCKFPLFLYFIKFVLNTCPEKLISPQNVSGSEDLKRNLSSGKQTYESKKDMWPVQEPIPKLEALHQV